MSIADVNITCADMVVKFEINDEIFHYKPVLPPEFLCSESTINASITTNNVDKVTVTWGNKRITFKKPTEERIALIEGKMNKGDATPNMWKMITGAS